MTKVKVKNLGLCAGMVSSFTAPNNEKVLWYDLSLVGQEDVKSPIKYYDLTTHNWEFLVK